MFGKTELTIADQDLDTGDIIGISSGVAAAIGLAVVAVVAVISGFSGKKLYDVYVKNKGKFSVLTKFDYC